MRTSCRSPLTCQKERTVCKWLGDNNRKEQSACRGRIGGRRNRRHSKEGKAIAGAAKRRGRRPYGMLAAEAMGKQEGGRENTAAFKPPC